MPTSTSRPAASAGLLTGLLAVLFGAALATAAPAAALDDPSRPDARVTHGPSCRPGGLVVEVVAGTSPYSVRLATTRRPAGEDEATLLPGQTVVLRTGDVAYGETIDGRLEFAAQDGTGVTYADELEEYSFTRPTKADCDAIAAPSTPGPATTGSPATTTTSTTGAGVEPSNSPTSATAPSGGSTTAVPGGSAPTGGGSDSAPRAVSAGDTITLQASGFLPGERVEVRLHGSGDVLAIATAGPDGNLQTEVRIPGGTGAGPATMRMAGAESAFVADVALQVAAAQTPVAGNDAADILPLTAAAVALVAAVGGLVSVAGRKRMRRPAIRSA
jgi:hypothetical protein